MKRLIFSILAGLASVAWAQPSASPQQEDWWWLGEFNNEQGRMQMYVDHRSAKLLKKDVIVSTVLYIVERPYPDGEVMRSVQVVLDCDDRTVGYTAYVTYDEQGREILSNRFDGLPMVRIEAKKASDVLRRHLCRDKPLPALAVPNPVAHTMKMLGREVPVKSAQAGQEEPQAAYGTGTGFFVSGNGDIVTSFHVVDGADRITVFTPDRKEHAARIMRASPATDLAVLHIDYASNNHLALAPANSAKPGDRVFTFGFPVVEMLGAEPKYTDGAISALSGLGGEAAFAQISVPVQPGNSGGPLVNEQSGVVGVIAAQAAVEAFADMAGALPQNVNWAVRSEYIAPLIGTQPVSRSLTREEAVARARQSVVIILAEKAAVKDEPAKKR